MAKTVTLAEAFEKTYKCFFVNESGFYSLILSSKLPTAKELKKWVTKKPVAKKALETAVSQTGEKLGKKISEKSGEIIMKKLANMRKGKKTMNVPSIMKKEKESTDMIINRLISGSGMRRRKRVTFI